MGANAAVGRYGEDVAVRYLSDHGMRVLERNWRCASGELDIVALDGSTLAVVEVKTRRSRAFGSPVEAIDSRKFARLRRLAAMWVDQRRDLLPGWSAAGGGIRLDAVGVLVPRRGPAIVEHLRGIG